tara:strand:- start:58 stop:1005 length:948 start_codon:yes stop_codon:yes gene_type:complete
MRPRLIWSLGNRRLNGNVHSPFVYDMFYLSIQTAKALGYRTVFYGTHDAVAIIGKWVDESYDVTNKVPYILYDDIKAWIWYNEPNGTTIDADVFLYNKLHFRSNQDVDDINVSKDIDLSNLAFSQPHISSNSSPVILRYEEFASAPPTGNVLDALNHFNSMNPKSVIPEWDYNSVSSLNTGIIGWNANDNGFRKHYCESYVKLREWYFKNENKLSSLHPMLQRHDSVVCHFICERLLFNLVKYHNIKTDELTGNVDNHYIHLKGGNKFKDKEFIHSVKTLVDYHKSNGGFIKNNHNYLAGQNKIKPFLFLRDKRT